MLAGIHSLEFDTGSGREGKPALVRKEAWSLKEEWSVQEDPEYDTRLHEGRRKKDSCMERILVERTPAVGSDIRTGRDLENTILSNMTKIRVGWMFVL